MPSATHEVTIHRPLDEVFAYVADGENCPAWRPGVLDIRRVAGTGVGSGTGTGGSTGTGGGTGVGERYAQGVRGPMGRRITADYEVTVFEPGRRIEFQTVAGPARPHGRYDFEPVDGGTRLRFALDAELGGLKRLFMGSAVQRTMDAEVRTLDNLKQVLEAG